MIQLTDKRGTEKRLLFRIQIIANTSKLAGIEKGMVTYFMKRKCIIAIICVLFCVAGITMLIEYGKPQINEASLSTCENEEKEYIWTKINQNVKIEPFGMSHNRGDLYFLTTIRFEPLCNEDNISGIEYNLENAVGKFMDSNKDDAYKNNVENVPYFLKGNNQESIYFTEYYTFKPDITHTEEVKYVTDIFEKIRIRLTITFNDGSVKERNFALKSTSIYNYKNFDMYEITLAE